MSFETSCSSNSIGEVQPSNEMLDSSANYNKIEGVSATETPLFSIKCVGTDKLGKFVRPVDGAKGWYKFVKSGESGNLGA